MFGDPRARRAAFFSVAAVALLVTIFLALRGSGSRSLGPAEAYALLRRDTTVVVLDVRTEEEFRSPTGRLENAVLIPVETLAARMGELSAWRGRTILVCCRSGRRSRNAVQLLTERGYTAVNLEGGLLAWNACGLPVIVEKGRR